MNPIEQQKRQALSWLAKQFVGVADQPGGGYLVNKFRMAVDGKAQGEAWCACFVQYCVKEVDGLLDSMLLAEMPHTILPPTESTQLLYAQTVIGQRSTEAHVGSIGVWQELANPSLGHCGVVTGIDDSGNVFTIEGNTSGTPSGDQRQGGCVWNKARAAGQIPGFKLLGYLLPWAP